MDGYKIKTKGFMKHVKDSRGIILIIAKRMGVSREHLTTWLNKNPTFWEYVYDEREGTVDIAESKLMNKLNNDEDWAIKFVLGSTNRGKRRGYSSEHSTVVNAELNTGPTYKFIIEKPDDNTNKLEAKQETTTGV